MSTKRNHKYSYSGLYTFGSQSSRLDRYYAGTKMYKMYQSPASEMGFLNAPAGGGSEGAGELRGRVLLAQLPFGASLHGCQIGSHRVLPGLSSLLTQNDAPKSQASKQASPLFLRGGLGRRGPALGALRPYTAPRIRSEETVEFKIRCRNGKTLHERSRFQKAATKETRPPRPGLPVSL